MLSSFASAVKDSAYNRYALLKKSISNPYILATAALTMGAAAQSFAQCEDPTVTKAEFCLGQQATIELQDSDLSVNYAWYNDQDTDLAGEYGEDGTGRTFISYIAQSGPRSFYYSKEVEDVISKPFTTLTGGEAVPYDAGSPFLMSFSNDLAFQLNTITAFVTIQDPSATYGIAVRYDNGTDSVYSSWFEVTTETPSADGVYRVSIPADLAIEPGTTNSIEIITGNEDLGVEPVDGFYWWGSSFYSGNTYMNGLVSIDDPAQAVGDASMVPMIFDWNITLKCERKEVTTELSDACCELVGDNIALSASSGGAPSSDSPITLTAEGADVVPGLHFLWTDEDGNPIGSGEDLTSYVATEAGEYFIKALFDPADADNRACYTSRSINIGLQNIFAPADFSICLGDPAALRGEGAEGRYNWFSDDATADSYIQTKNAQETDLYILQPGTYTYTVSGIVKLGNVARDGKFELFDINNPAFENDNKYEFKDIVNEGDYLIDDEIYAYSGYHCTDEEYWVKLDEETNTEISRGNIFVADAAAFRSQTPFTVDFAKNNPLWKMNVNVKANTRYSLSVDVSNWNDIENPPNIMVVVNDEALNITSVSGNGATLSTAGDYYYAFPKGEANKCTWETIEATWNSGSNTNVTLYIAEVTNEQSGYEFAMDDITFYEGRGLQTDEVEITVDDCNELEVRADGTACIGEAFKLYTIANNGAFLNWTDSKGKIVSTKENTEVFPLSDETYTATAKFPLISFIKNGGFEQDNRPDFDHDFEHPYKDLNAGGLYIVSSSDTSAIISPLVGGFDDHSAAGSGHVLMTFADYAEQYDYVRKTIPQTAGEEYIFSTWVRRMDNGSTSYNFDILIDGVTVETSTIAGDYEWHEVKYTWLAEGNSDVEVRLQLAAASGYPAGVAIDDVLLAQLGGALTDDVTVTASLCNTLSIDQICTEDRVKEVTYETDGIFMGWYEEDGTFISDADTLRYEDFSDDITIAAKMGVSTSALNQDPDMELGGIDLDMAGIENTQMYGASTYAFVSDASSLTGNTDFVALEDPTGGKYMVVDPGDAADQVIFQTAPMSFDAGTIYQFSISTSYVKDADYLATIPELYPIRLAIDGVEVASFELQTAVGWQELNFSWTHETAGESVIELIVDCSVGYDYIQLAYAFDNFELKPVYEAATEEILLEACTPPCNQPASISITTPDAICEGDDLSISAQYEDGGLAVQNTSMAYVWYLKGDNPGAYTDIASTSIPDETFTALSESATYILRVEDGTEGAEKCYLEEEVTVQVDAEFTVDLGDPLNICGGETATLDAGITDASYEWSTTDATQTVSVTDEDTYTVTVTLGACSAEGSIDVAVTPIPTLTLSPDGEQNICEGQSVEFTASVAEAGDWEFEFYKEGAVDQAQSATATYSTGEAGIYKVAAFSTINERCSSESDKVTVNLDGKPTVNLSADAQQVCDGSAELSVTVGSGNWQVAFYDADDIPVQALSEKLTYSADATGSYYAYAENVDNPACSNNSDPVAIEIGTTPVADLEVANSVLAYCEGGSGTIQVTDLPAVTYAWFNSTGAVAGDKNILENLPAETYSVEVTSGFCTDTIKDIAIEEKAKPTYTFSGTDQACEGGVIPNVNLELTGIGPWDIEYSNGAENVSTTISASSEMLAPGANTAGEYTFTMVSIYDRGTECSGDIVPTETAAITIIKPDFDFNTITPACENGNDIDLSQSVDGTGTFAYASDAGTIDAATGVFSVASGTGNYTISATMTDANGCESDTKTQSLEIWQAPSANITGDEFVCAGSETELDGNPTGGTAPYATHLWTGETSPLSSTNTQRSTFAPATEGVYTINYTATDIHGCTGSATIEIEVIDIPTVNINAISDFCSDDAAAELDGTFATVSPAGGTYTWKIDGNNAIEIDPNSLSAGVHQISLDYFNSCEAPTAEGSFEIIFAEKPTIETNPVFALTTELPHADLIAEGTGSEFRWYATETDPGNGISPIATGAIFNPAHTAADIYLYYLTQMVNGCESQPVEAIIELSDCETPAPAVSSFEICEDESTPALTATGTGAIRWYSDATKQDLLTTGTIYTPANVQTGENIYYVTQDNNDCQGPAALANITVNALPTLTFSLQEDICQEENPITLPALVNPIGGTFTGSSSSNELDPAMYSDDAVTITYDYTDAKGCSNNIDKTIRVHKTPSVSIAGLDASYCASSDESVLNFSGSSGGSAAWSSSFAGSLSGNTFKPVAFTGIEESTVTIELAYTDDYGCSDTDETTTIVYGTVKNTPSEDIEPVCLDASSFDLASYMPAGIPTDGTYSGNGILAGSTFDPLMAGTGDWHTVLYSYNDVAINCPAQVTFALSVKGLPDVELWVPADMCMNDDAAIIEDYIICDKDIASLSYSGARLSSNIFDDIVFDPDRNPGIYTIEAEIIDEDGCVGSDQATIIVHDFPTVEITGDSMVCEFGRDAEYVTTVFDNDHNYDYDYTWSVTNTDVLIKPSGNEAMANWSAAGFDTIMVTVRPKENTFGCPGTGELLVSVAKEPEAGLVWSLPSNSPYDALEYDVNLTNTTHQTLITENEITQEITYESVWNFGEALGNETYTQLYEDAKETFTWPFPFGEHKISLSVTSDHGCKSTVETEFFIKIRTGFFIANAFAPGQESEGLNYFGPVGFNLKNYKMWIYDQWGNTVFFTDKLINGKPAVAWDGRHKGVLMPAGTYTWKIEADFLDGKKWEGIELTNGRMSKYGNVILLR